MMLENITTTSAIILGGFGIILIYLIQFWLASRERGVNVLGGSTIQQNLFYIGKLSILFTLLALVLQAFNVNLRWNPSYPAFAETIAVVIFVFAFIVFMMSFFYLGNSLRVGLPQSHTHLKITGIYRVSRNPMYLGVYLMMVSAIFYTFNPLVLVVTVIAILIHHKIILAEEKYLGQKFGASYKAYCARVRRYL